MRNVTFLAFLFFATFLKATLAEAQGCYVAGDFHQHTTYSDGSFSFGYMMEKNNKYDLDWWANSEHGGAFSRWGSVSGVDLKDTTEVLWANTGINILGKANNGNMWRWQSIRDWSYRDIQLWRRVFSNKLIIQGYEMNVPGHEHASMCIIANQFNSDNSNVDPIAQFEYMFDNNDKDDTQPNGWTKSTKTGHEKAVEAVTWLQANYPSQSYLIPAHPERYKYNGNTGWNIEHFRDMNNAAPDVFFGFESVPGHQKSSKRGEYGSNRPSYGMSTYGGAGLMSAKVGGLWDALLSEGRHFWLFASSDCHDIKNDFYPGEYQKTYTYVEKKNDAQAVVDGLRSGNSYVVMGDLIDSLIFTVGSATMGQTYETKNTVIEVKIQVRDPQRNNNNTYSTYTNPELDHIDLIVGQYGSKVDPANTEEYKKDSVLTTKVVARYGKNAGYTDAAGITTQAWSEKSNGWKEIAIQYPIEVANKLYFRLRGTNHSVNKAGETDNYGNPLIDAEGENTAAKTFEDLWFYSNPIFVSNTAATVARAMSDKSEFLIFPNPADDEVRLSFSTPQSGFAMIYNMTGGLIRKVALNNDNEKIISIRDLSNGTYVVSVNNLPTQKLIVK
jgi:hypothetical protein